MIQDYKKRQSRNQRFSSAHVTSTNKASDKSVQFTIEEIARFHLYQELLKSPSTPITDIVESGNPNKCPSLLRPPNWSLILEPHIT